LRVASPSEPFQERARVGNIDTGVVGGIGDRYDLAVISLGLGGFTGAFGSLRRTEIGTEPIWLLLPICYWPSSRAFPSNVRGMNLAQAHPVMGSKHETVGNGSRWPADGMHPAYRE
jgi:hypothetical protein